MLLAKYNLEESITKKTTAYLKKTTLSFSQFKTHILSKAPIPLIQSKIVAALTRAKNADQISVKEALEKQAYEKQLADDEQQNIHDAEASTKDEALKERTIRELDQVLNKRKGYQNQVEQLKLQLTRLLLPIPNVIVTHHHGTNITRSTVPLGGNRLALSQLQQSIFIAENKIAPLLEKERILKNTLDKIELHIKQRRTHQNEKNTRDQARTGYLNSGEGIIKTLSAAHAKQLSQNIANQFQALEIKCADLIKQSEEQCQHAFIKQLPAHLKKTKLKSSETEALTIILKLMSQHLQHEQESNNTRSTLKKINISISQQQKKLEELKTQLQQLNKNQPDLTEVNKKLLDQNTNLTHLLEHNTSTYQSLGAPALLTLSLSLLFTIPLILTLNGIIPFFISAVWLYTLVASPPTLLFLATISLGIAAAVYSYKAGSNAQEIKINKQLITENMKHINGNSHTTTLLQTNTIPNLEKQIKKDEKLREELTATLETSQRLAQQTFKQAKEVEPVLASKAPKAGFNQSAGVVQSHAVADSLQAPGF